MLSECSPDQWPCFLKKYVVGRGGRCREEGYMGRSGSQEDTGGVTLLCPGGGRTNTSWMGWVGWGATEGWTVENGLNIDYKFEGGKIKDKYRVSF